MSNFKDKEKIRALGLSKIKRHFFICVSEKNSKCCPIDSARKSFAYLKKRLLELGLSENGGIQRSKVSCLRICSQGPIGVIYPDNVWYHSLSEDVIEQIINEHLINGQVVSKYQIM